MRQRPLALLLPLIILSLSLAGCTGSPDDNEEKGDQELTTNIDVRETDNSTNETGSSNTDGPTAR